MASAARVFAWLSRQLLSVASLRSPLAIATGLCPGLSATNRITPIVQSSRCGASGTDRFTESRRERVRSARYLNRSLSEAQTGVPITRDARGEGMLAAIEPIADRYDFIFFNPALKIIPPIALRRSLTTTSIDAPCLKAIFWTGRLRSI